jgi:hypothetical protein
VLLEALRQAARQGAAAMSVRLRSEDGNAVLTITGEGLRSPLDALPLDDRAAVGGGQITVTPLESGRQTVSVVLPCG